MRLARNQPVDVVRDAYISMLRFYQQNFPAEFPRLVAELTGARGLGAVDYSQATAGTATYTPPSTDSRSLWDKAMDVFGSVGAAALQAVGTYKITQYQDRRAQESAEEEYQNQLVAARQRAQAYAVQSEELGAKANALAQAAEIERLERAKSWQKYMVPGGLALAALAAWAIFK